MSVPTASNFPDEFDTDTNLHVVHDALRVVLAEDYTAGDTSITIVPDELIMPNFPETGIITLTEQVSEIENRAISLYYASRTDTTFDDLVLLDGFTDSDKPKLKTNVTINVTAHHHNNLKDALIAIEEFVGIKGSCDTQPFGETLAGRTCFLQRLIQKPKAWFSASTILGVAPLSVTFQDQSFHLGSGTITYLWSFGDNTISTLSTITATSVVPTDEINVEVQDLDGDFIVKTYTTPGIYDVSIEVTNEYGTDTCLFESMITVMAEAPDEAVIDFVPSALQTATDGSPSGGPYTTPPTLRSRTNRFVDLIVEDGENPATPGVTYAGEELSGGTPIDPITTYTWSLSDDLLQPNSNTARASYSVGGYYDVQLRVDTEFGSYRITTYEDAIDIVEKQNLWLFTGSLSIRGHEFGLLSETFKNAGDVQSISTDDSFLDGSNNEDQAKQEFARNIAFIPRSTTASGDSGTALICYASGGSVVTDQEINILEYNGFNDTYTSHTAISSRPWNWIALNSPTKTYFLFGQDPTPVSNYNVSYQYQTSYDHSTLTATTTALSGSNYTGPAAELTQHVSSFSSGVPTNGYFAVYRTAWKDQTGYILRNDGVGDFFRIKSFYRTSGTLSEPFQTLVKLPDMTGAVKTEGQLVTLNNGVYFFNNSGDVVVYNDTSSTWQTGGVAAVSATFTTLQDNSVEGFANVDNTLLAASDGDRTAYLSYDYSEEAFIKFNGQDLTFSNVGPRPTGTQFTMGIF